MYARIRVKGTASIISNVTLHAKMTLPFSHRYTYTPF